MGFEMVSYDAIKDNVYHTMVAVAKKYEYFIKVDDLKSLANPMQISIKYPNISSERLPQLSFLLALIKALDASTESEADRALILHGACCYMQWRVEVESKKPSRIAEYLFSYVKTRDPKDSKFYQGLTISLDTHDPKKAPTAKELHKMFSALKIFIYKHVYKDPKNEDLGFVPSEKQLFANDKIYGFKLEKFLKVLGTKIIALEDETLCYTKSAASYELAKELMLGRAVRHDVSASSSLDTVARHILPDNFLDADTLNLALLQAIESPVVEVEQPIPMEPSSLPSSDEDGEQGYEDDDVLRQEDGYFAAPVM